MRKYSELVSLRCGQCGESYHLKKKKRPQEVEVYRPPEKKNPFHVLDNGYSVDEGKIRKVYQIVICSNCGNLFVVLTEEKLIEKVPEEKEIDK